MNHRAMTYRLVDHCFGRPTLRHVLKIITRHSETLQAFKPKIINLCHILFAKVYIINTPSIDQTPK